MTKSFVNRRGILSAVKPAWSNQSRRGIWWISECGQELLRDHTGVPQQNQNHTGNKMSYILGSKLCGASVKTLRFSPRWRSSWIDCCTISTSWRRQASCSGPFIRKLNGLSTTARVRRAWKRSAFMDSTEASVERMVCVWHHCCLVWLSLSRLGYQFLTSWFSPRSHRLWSGSVFCCQLCAVCAGSVFSPERRRIQVYLRVEGSNRRLY